MVGGAGYIGSHACKALAQRGFTPIAFDNLIYGHRDFVKWGPFIEGNLSDADCLLRAFSDHKIDAVMHFAAYAYVGESVTDPAKYYENNLANTLNLLACMRKAGVARIVFSSTCATYGIPESIPIPETHAQHPINPYGWSKLMVEQVLRDYDHAYGIRHAALRYFNAAGADPDAEIGEWHEPETHLIPLVLDTAQGKRGAIHVFGSDYPTPDGTCIRDYIHVSDLADAHVLALEALLEGAASMALNLGNGNGYSVREVIATARDITGKPILEELHPRRPGDPAVLVGDPALAIERLGWKPRMSSIQKIIGDAWRWHEARSSSFSQARG